MEDQAISILKQAILLERRGKAFYSKTAQQSANSAVREFFETMAEEENRHEEILSSQYRAVLAREKFDGIELPEALAASRILTSDLVEKIASAGFEAAAISAAMSMEARAVQIYSERAHSATDPQEKAIYAWLAEWETGHLNMLSELDRSLTESIWNDNSFWPF